MSSARIPKLIFPRGSLEVNPEKATKHLPSQASRQLNAVVAIRQAIMRSAPVEYRPPAGPGPRPKNHLRWNDFESSRKTVKNSPVVTYNIVQPVSGGTG
jgi:hypothetical protein